MFEEIWKLFHKHKWDTVYVNSWNISIEERCKCGEYRHHMFKHRSGDEIE